MAAGALDESRVKSAERLHAPVRRCRDLPEMTMVSDVMRELLGIATELDREAERDSRK